MKKAQGNGAAWDLNKDGKLQKNEADEWGLNHGGDITVNGNNIDLTVFKVSSLIRNGNGTFGYSTTAAFRDLPFETATTYGGSTFELVNGKWRMLSQLYHFKFRANDSKENIRRNILNFIGFPINTVNTPFGVMPGPNAYSTFRPFYITIEY